MLPLLRRLITKGSIIMTNSGLTDNGEAFVLTLYSENYRDHTIEIRTALDRRSALVYEGFIDSDKERP